MQKRHCAHLAAIAVELDANAVGAGFVQPVERPLGEVSVGGGRNGLEEIADGGGAPGVCLQVVADALAKGVGAHQLLKLRQRRRALVVGDGVEVGEGIVRGGHWQFDGVGGVALVGSVGGH